FNALEYIPGVTVRYVGSVGELGQPDLLILPGTKNTMDDLLWLRQNGLEAATLRHAASGRPVIGICGGYQMLGERLDDPDGIEHGGTLRGMGLLPAKTIFEPQKIRTRAAGRFEAVGGIFSGLSGAEFEGYEIHMGVTVPTGDCRALGTIHTLGGLSAQKTDGLQSGNVYGSYLHGFFDREGVAQAIVGALLREKGLDETQLHSVDLDAHKQCQYDRLADAVRLHLDMPAVYRILQEGVTSDEP
ncbi:MAG: cobyric acid synthase CobQ, partial [Oscillospiraceae bacterium]